LKEDITARREKRAKERPDDVVTPRITQPKSPPGKLEERSLGGAAPLPDPHEVLAIAVEEIKDLIRTEFRALRADIGIWRNSK
jgi:hypothetical protein